MKEILFFLLVLLASFIAVQESSVLQALQTVSLSTVAGMILAKGRRKIP